MAHSFHEIHSSCFCLVVVAVLSQIVGVTLNWKVEVGEVVNEELKDVVYFLGRFEMEEEEEGYFVQVVVVVVQLYLDLHQV